MVKDFWAEPLYVPLLLDMQNRVHDYVVANKGTSKQALELVGQGLDQGVQAGRQGSFLSAQRLVLSTSSPAAQSAGETGLVRKRAGYVGDE